MAPYGVAVPAKITIEFADRILRCAAPDLNIGFRSGGRWDDMVIHNPYDVQLTRKKEEAPVPPEDSKTPETGLTHEQKMGLTAVRIAAQRIERQKFLNARAIHGAILEAQKLSAEAEHKFNLSVLESLHTGLTQEAIEKVLEYGGFGELEEKVEAIQDLDMGLLYVGSE